MELVAWNQGIGTFASEVGPSTFFRAYRTIKEQEAKGKPRSEIVGMLMERFGENLTSAQRDKKRAEILREVFNAAEIA